MCRRTYGRLYTRERDEIAAYWDSGVIVDKAFFDELSGETGEATFRS
jgi:hypothetical protein